MSEGRIKLMKSQNRVHNPFHINVFVPVTSRWTKVPIPTAGQQAMVRGELFRREESGLYTITLVEISLPSRDHSSGAPSPSPKKVRRVVKRNTVEAFDDDPEQEPAAGPSSTTSDVIEGGVSEGASGPAGKKSGKGKGVDRG